jgi:nucleotide-binding universal stress UspA family protein
MATKRETPSDNEKASTAVPGQAKGSNDASGEATGVIERLLFVADSAVAEVDDLPFAARAAFDAAARVYVVTPSLPGRLAWLADDVDRFRHFADERLDAVLAHMESIGAHATGAAGRASVLTVIADAVAKFDPDHILVGLRSSEHASWQEHRLVERIESRFGLPVTTYAVDPRGHAFTADGPLLLAYDGSEAATCAIERAAALFPGHHALVVSVWQPTALGSQAWSGAIESMSDFVAVDRAAADRSGAIADEGVRVARAGGLRAEPLAVISAGPVSTTLLEAADRVDAATIVMGSRGLTGLRSILLGSVSRAVLHETKRPTLIVRPPHDR